MELDKIEEYHPCNRSNMKAVYLAYLQNNRGSKKAVRECIRGVEEKENAQKAADSETKPKPKTGSKEKKTTGSGSDVRSESSEDGDSGQRKGKNSNKKTTAGKEK